MVTHHFDDEVYIRTMIKTSITKNSLSSPVHAAISLFSSKSQQLNHNINNSHNYNDDKDSISACLLIMDDNHFLTEWIAYHYFVAQLRRLIIAIDPKSLTSPLPILNRWKDKINITVWTSDMDYMDINLNHNEFNIAKVKIKREFSETTPELIEHRARQRLFYTHCLRDLKQQQQQQPSSWTMLIDVDEFIRINYKKVEVWKKNITNTNIKMKPHITAIIPSMNKSGSVATLLRRLAVVDADSTNTDVSVTASTYLKGEMPLFNLQSSPCVQIPRYRFVSSSSSSININSTIDNDIDTNNLLTQKYHDHARGRDYKRNKISKTIIDLQRIPLEDIIEVDSIHMPIRKYCSQRNLHLQPSDSLLVINHYLGSYEQFTYRDNDARNLIINKYKNGGVTNATKTKVNVRDAKTFEEHQKLSYPADTDDEIQPWLEGFLNGDSAKTIKRQKDNNIKSNEKNINNNNNHAVLLEGVGQLEPKSWQPIFFSRHSRDENDQKNNDRCALLFFGLTRSYKTMVLPSIIKNILRPNARHACDVYVHFYKQDVELPGRRNRGGYLRPDEIFLLEDAVHSVAQDYYENNGQHSILQYDNNTRPAFIPPIVAFTHDTPEQFNDRRSEQLRRYRDDTTTIMTTEDGGTNVTTRTYFPWAAKSYTNTSLENIVKQWHSIECVFKLMDFTAIIQKLSYSRVGMFRSDALFVTPIDIASFGINNSINGDDDRDDRTESMQNNTMMIPRYDINNHYYVTPSFAMNPVNDRIVYGPYEAVKVWATKRFDLIEESAKLQTNPGYTMHSERFLNSTVFPAIKKLGYEQITNRDICFLRTRADETALLNDCSMESLIPTPLNSYWNDPSLSSEDVKNLRLSSVESIVGKKCAVYQMSPKWKFVGCGQEGEYKNWGDSGWK